MAVDFLAEHVLEREAMIDDWVHRLDTAVGRPLVGPAKLRYAVEAGFQSYDAFTRAPFERLSAIPGFGPQVAGTIVRAFGGTAPSPTARVHRPLVYDPVADRRGRTENSVSDDGPASSPGTVSADPASVIGPTVPDAPAPPPSTPSPDADPTHSVGPAAALPVGLQSPPANGPTPDPEGPPPSTAADTGSTSTPDPELLAEGDLSEVPPPAAPVPEAAGQSDSTHQSTPDPGDSTLGARDSVPESGGDDRVDGPPLVEGPIRDPDPTLEEVPPPDDGAVEPASIPRNPPPSVDEHPSAPTERPLADPPAGDTEVPVAPPTPIPATIGEVPPAAIGPDPSSVAPPPPVAPSSGDVAPPIPAGPAPGLTFSTGVAANDAWRLFLDATGAGHRGLCVSREFPDRMRALLGARDVSIVWVSTATRAGSIRPNDLAALRAAVERAVGQEGVGAVYVDSIEYLIRVNGLDPVLELLREVDRLVKERLGRAWIPINPLLVAPADADRLGAAFPTAH